MKRHLLFFYVALLSFGLMPKAVAGQVFQPISDMPRLKDVEHPNTSAHLLTQEPVPTQPSKLQAQVVEVRGVRLSPIANGLEIILETAAGQQRQVFTSIEGNTLIVDISNTQLRLPSAREFRANNPVENVVSVTVSNQNANSIQVRVTGMTS